MLRLGMHTSSIFNSQHLATRCNRVAKRTQPVAPNNVAICCVQMLRSFSRSLQMLCQQCRDILRWDVAILRSGLYGRRKKKYTLIDICTEHFWRALSHSICKRIRSLINLEQGNRSFSMYNSHHKLSKDVCANCFCSTIATCQRNISQHCWPQHVACVWLKFDHFQIWANNTQHVATHRNTENFRKLKVALNPM